MGASGVATKIAAFVLVCALASICRVDAQSMVHRALDRDADRYVFVNIGYGFRNALYDINPKSISCKEEIRQSCEDATRLHDENYGKVVEALRVKKSSLVHAHMYACLKDNFYNDDGGQSHEPWRRKLSDACRADLEHFRQKKTDVAARLKIVEECHKPLSTCPKRHNVVQSPIRCLWKNTSAPPGCKAAVTKLLAKSAGNIEEDKGLSKMCQSEVAKECGGRFNKISCLKQMVQKAPERFSEECKTEVHRRMIVESDDFRYNKYLSQVCSYDKERHCKEVPYGQGRVVGCLENFYQHLQPECRSAIKKGIRNKHKDIRLDTRFRLICKEDADRLCPEHAQQSSNAKHQFAQMVSNRRSPLLLCMKNATAEAKHFANPHCKNYIMSLISRNRKFTELDTGLMEACDEENKGVCHGSPNLLKCLHNRVRDGVPISGKCEAALAYRDILASADLMMKTEISTACHTEYQTFCAGETNANAPGNKLACLQDHMDEPDFKDTCRERIKEDLSYSTQNIRMLSSTYHYCKSTIDTLCPDLKPGNGQVLNCLKESRQDIEDAQCRSSILRLFRLTSVDWKLDWSTHFACEDDAMKLCSDETDISVNTCLQQKYSQLSLACQDMQKTLMEAESDTLDVNWRVKYSCAKARQMYCPDVPDGDGRVLGCIEENMSDKDFPSMCKSVVTHFLSRVTSAAEKENMRLIPTIQRKCLRDIDAHCRMGTEIANPSWGNDLNSMVMGCLIRESEKLENKCRTTVTRRTRTMLKHFIADSPVTGVCDADVERLCNVKPSQFPMATDGSIVKCLRSNVEDVSRECFTILSVSKRNEGNPVVDGHWDLYGSGNTTLSKHVKAIDEKLSSLEVTTAMGSLYYAMFTALAFSIVVAGAVFVKNKKDSKGAVVYRDLKG